MFHRAGLDREPNCPLHTCAILKFSIAETGRNKQAVNSNEMFTKKEETLPSGSISSSVSVMFLAAAGRFKFFQLLQCLPAQILGHLNFHTHIVISPDGTDFCRLTVSLSGQADFGAGLGAGFDLAYNGAVQRPDRYLATQHSGGEGNFGGRIQILPLPAPSGFAGYRDPQQQVAGFCRPPAFLCPEAGWFLPLSIPAGIFIS